jgi:hypothetical protein
MRYIFSKKLNRKNVSLPEGGAGVGSIACGEHALRAIEKEKHF